MKIVEFKLFRKLHRIIFSPILHWLPNSSRLKIEKRIAQNRRNTMMVWEDRNWGFGISIAKWKYWLVLGLPLEILIGAILFTFIVAGMDIGDKSLMIIFISASLLFAYPLDKAIEKDCYLKYFKEFEKKDEQWHRKWKRISILFTIGMMLSLPLLIWYMIAIQ